MSLIRWDHVIHDIQIASSKAPGGPIADWILDGLWPAVIERKIVPYESTLRQCAGVQVWLPGTFEPRIDAPIRYSTQPVGDFRDNIDPRLKRLMDTYRIEFVQPLRLRFGIRRVFTYLGCLPQDDVLFEASLQDRFDVELRRQTMPWAGTTIIIDQWAEATMDDAPTLRKVANISGARGEVGVEGTVRKGSASAGNSRCIKLWLEAKRLKGPAYCTTEEAAVLPGMKIEMLRGWDGDKKARAEYLTTLTTDGQPTPIHVCSGVESLI